MLLIPNAFKLYNILTRERMAGSPGERHDCPPAYERPAYEAVKAK
jgi:hypothetical protein